VCAESLGTGGLIRSTPMFDLLLPLTTVFCACSTVVWALALLDLLK
jgi:hypothetical protein